MNRIIRKRQRRRKKKPLEQLPTMKTIKTSLKSVIKDRKNISVINHYCKMINQIRIRADQFIALYCLHQYHFNNQQLPSIDKKFIEHCIKTIAEPDGRGMQFSDPVLEAFYDEHFIKVLPKNYDVLSYACLSNSINFLVGEILKDYENNITMHFDKRLKAYIRSQFSNQITQANKNKILNGIDKIVSDLMYNKNESTGEFLTWKNNNRHLIAPPQTDIKNSISYDIECDAFKYMKYMIYMNIQLEHLDRKMFSCFPMRTSLIPSYYSLDTKSLITMLIDTKKFGVSQTKMVQKPTQYKDAVWNDLFKISKINKFMKDKNYVFRHTISTDGIGLSLTYVRKDLKDKTNIKDTRPPERNDSEFTYITELPKQELKQLKDYNKISCDPGTGRDILYFRDENGNTLSHTKMTRRLQTYAKKKREIIERDMKVCNIKSIEQPLTETKSKSCNYNTFVHYLIVRNIVNKQLRAYYEQDFFRKFRFRSFTETQKSESILINKIRETFGKKIVIGFGSFNQTQTKKFMTSTPLKSLKRLLMRHFKMYIIDEFRTSKVCSYCQKGENKYYLKRPNPRPYRNDEKYCHGLLACSKCKEENETNPNKFLHNRNNNGASNILDIMCEWINKQRRSLIFRRGIKFQDALQIVNQ
jgi:hypothetical protein